MTAYVGARVVSRARRVSAPPRSPARATPRHRGAARLPIRRAARPPAFRVSLLPSFPSRRSRVLPSRTQRLPSLPGRVPRASRTCVEGSLVRLEGLVRLVCLAALTAVVLPASATTDSATDNLPALKNNNADLLAALRVRRASALFFSPRETEIIRKSLLSLR